jgi:hypothetical protein
MDTGQARFQKAIVYSACIGIFVGAALYVGYGLAFELLVMPSLRTPGAPFLSYGQQAVVLTVIAGLVCGAAGASIALCAFRRWLTSALVVFGVCVPTAAFVSQCWLDHFAKWGPDPTARILYWPFVALLPIVVIVWFVSMIGLAALWYWRSSRNHP